MAKKKENKQNGNRELAEAMENNECKDVRCPYHGKLRFHGRTFEGNIKKIVGKRAVIEFGRLLYIPKYERYYKKKTRLHAHIPDCIKVKVGDLVLAGECRPLSKIVKFVILKKIQ